MIYYNDDLSQLNEIIHIVQLMRMLSKSKYYINILLKVEYLLDYTLYVISFIIEYKQCLLNTHVLYIEIHTLLNYNHLLYIPILLAPSIV